MKAKQNNNIENEEAIDIVRLRFYDGKGRCILNGAIDRTKKRKAKRLKRIKPTH